MPRARVPKKSRDELEEIQRILTKYAKHPAWDRVIRTELGKLEQPAMTKVRAKIRAIPSKGAKRRRSGRDLRDEMVDALRWSVDTSRQYTGAFLFLDARRMPGNRDNLPAYMEGVRRYTRWRHQVFGNEEKYVTQTKHPYFYRTLRPFETKVAQAAEAVIKAIGDGIENDH